MLGAGAALGLVAGQHAVGLAQRRRDLRGDLLLHREDVAGRQRPVVGSVPEHLAGLGVGQHGADMDADRPRSGCSPAPRRRCRACGRARAGRRPGSARSSPGVENSRTSGKRMSWAITSWVIPAARRRSSSSVLSSREGQHDQRRPARLLRRQQPVPPEPGTDATAARSAAARSTARSDPAPRRPSPARRRGRPRRPVGGRSAAGGPGRSCGRGRAALPLEMRDVAALGNGDPHRVAAAGVDIVAVEVAAQPPRLQPHHRVGAGVEAARRGRRPRVATVKPFSRSERPSSVSSTRKRSRSRRRALSRSDALDSMRSSWSRDVGDRRRKARAARSASEVGRVGPSTSARRARTAPRTGPRGSNTATAATGKAPAADRVTGSRRRGR